MLSPVERAVLIDLLLNGDNIPSNIAGNTGKHQKSVSNKLPDMIEAGLVENKGRGVYTLTQEGLNAARSLDDYSY
jgi:predicted transcriptional regulator